MTDDMNIESMDLDELKEMAKTLDVGHASNIGADKLRTKIQEKLGEPMEEPELSHPSVENDEDRITIIVNKSETDKQPVQVFLNGKSFIMKRGMEVAVPKGVIEILNNAKKLVWDGDMKEYNEVNRYPYTVVV